MGLSDKQQLDLAIAWENENQRADLLRFVEANPFLGGLLTEVVEKLGAYFVRPHLSLEVVDDPEGDSQQLVLTIDTDLKAEEAVERFERFHQDWWLDNLWRSDLKLVIALHYP